MSVSATTTRGFVASAGTAVAVTSTTISSANTWTELTASTSSSILVTAIVWRSSSATWTVDLGTGAAASEVAVATIALTTNAGTTMYYALPYPLRIASGTRIAARTTSTNLSFVAILSVAEGKVI